MSDVPAGALADALAVRVAAAPEQPFLFFRGERAHFRWWSAERSLALLQGAPSEPLRAGEPAAVEWLRACARRGDPALAQALGRAIGPAPAARDVWIATRAEPDALDAAFVLRLAGDGGAVVWEPGSELRPDLALWIRPTLLDGTATELLVLAAGWSRAAPRWRRDRWLRRRLARLRAVIVTDGDAEKVALGLAAKLPALAARVLPFPQARW